MISTHKFTCFYLFFQTLNLIISSKEPDLSQPSLDKIIPEDYNLPKNYKDFYRINPKNFESRILRTEETWIVIFTSKSDLDFQINWKSLAKKHKGGVLFGVVDMSKDQVHHDFGMERLKIVGKDKDWPTKDQIENGSKVGEIAIIYRGKAKPEYVPNTVKAVRMASRFEPATSVRHFKPSEDADSAMYKFVVPAFYHSKPYPRFPILMIYEDKEALPWVCKYLMNHKLFNVYFDFRAMKMSEFSHLKKMFKDVAEPTSFPNFLALVGKEPKEVTGDLDMTFDIVQYVEKKFGPATSFKGVSEFLFWLNGEYREVLPGRKFQESSNQLIKPLADALRKRVEGIEGKKTAQKKEPEQKQKIVREEL